MKCAALFFLPAMFLLLSGCSELPFAAVGPQGGGQPQPLNEQMPLPRAFAPPRPMRRQRLNAALGRAVVPSDSGMAPPDAELETALEQDLQNQDFSYDGDDFALQASLERELQGQNFSDNEEDFGLAAALEQDLRNQDFMQYPRSAFIRT